MNNLLSYFGLVDTRISASEKDLPVHYYIALKLPHKTREEEEKFAVGKRCKFLHKNTIKEGKIPTQY